MLCIGKGNVMCCKKNEYFIIYCIILALTFCLAGDTFSGDRFYNPAANNSLLCANDGLFCADAGSMDFTANALYLTGTNSFSFDMACETTLKSVSSSCSLLTHSFLRASKNGHSLCLIFLSPLWMSLFLLCCNYNLYDTYIAPKPGILGIRITGFMEQSDGKK